MAWGNNAFGQLGDGTTTNRNTPVPVLLPAGTTVTAIAAGCDFSLAVTASGGVLAWGDNSSGQLGDGTTVNRDTPVSTLLPAGTTVTGVGGGQAHSVAVTSTGSVLSWGDNSFAALGIGSVGGIFTTPQVTSLPAGTTVTSVVAGLFYSMGKTANGMILAWGNNFRGQLGVGTSGLGDVRTTPVFTLLPAGTTVTAIATANNASHSLAVTSSGGALAWGFNNVGQLGDGTTTDRSTPVPVLLPAGTTVTSVAGSGGANFQTGASGHSLAVTSTGAVLAWGDNTAGQLGDGTTTNRLAPVFTLLPTGAVVSAVAAGETHSLAVSETTSSTTLQASPNPAVVGQPVTLTATVSCTVGPPTGTVTFFDGPTPLGTSPLNGAGVATLTTTSLSIGSHPLTGQYSGDVNCPASISNTVNEVIQQGTSTTHLAASQTNPSFGQPITLTATVSCTAGGAPTGTVTFSEGATTIGTVPLNGSGSASLTVNGLSPGSHTYTAQYTGDNNCAASTSNAVTVTVGCQMISGNVYGNLAVTSAVCLAPGSQVFGNVIISGSGSLAAQGATIQGVLHATGGTGLRLCSSTVNGATSASGINGVVVLGDAGDDNTPACGGNTFRGSVIADSNQGFLEISGNQILGAVTLTGNHTTILVPPENAPATEIEANRIQGSLGCFANTPPPINDNKPNTVLGPRNGQCAGL